MSARTLIGSAMAIALAGGATAWMLMSPAVDSVAAQAPATQPPPVEPQPLPPGSETSPSRPTLDNTNPPPLTFHPETLDLGKLRPNQATEGTATITNVGKDAVWIVKSVADCSCTSVDLPNQRLMPGESVQMRLNYRATSTMGPKKAAVKIAIRNFDIVQFPIIAQVELPVMAEPTFISALASEDGTQPLMGTFKVFSLDKRPFRVLAVNGSPATFTDFDPAKDQPRDTYTLKWDFTSFNPNTCVDPQGKRLPPFLVVETDHPECPVFDLEVRHQCARRAPFAPTDTWALQEKRVLADRFTDGKYADFEVMAKWLPRKENNDFINSLTTDSNQFAVELLGIEKTRDGQLIRLRVTLKPGHQGLVWGNVTVRSPGQIGSILVTGSAR